MYSLIILSAGKIKIMPDILVNRTFAIMLTTIKKKSVRIQDVIISHSECQYIQDCDIRKKYFLDKARVN